MNTHTIVIYMTTSSKEEAQNIAKTLVEEHLIACANILAPMESHYIWKNTLQCDQEIPVILKTTESQLTSATKRIKELHSYSVPCVVAFPIVGGNNEFIDWLRSQTKID